MIDNKTLNFIMLTDGEASQAGSIFNIDALEAILIETGYIETECDKSRMTAWFRYNDAPIEIYNGQRGNLMYDRLIKHAKEIKGADFVAVEDIEINNIRMNLDIEYLQSVTVVGDPHIDGGGFPGGRIFANVQYRESTQPIVLYKGDMRVCYRLYHSLARVLDKMPSVELIQVHGGTDESESILPR